ncbi:hypothetical protein GCM10022224_026670 [Nonomuraea antimicrobica]|uniref:Uncharacterized protein n=1 Tax=Nonomuraea antimicrobica TaxID=561173 RepID=A0ABP7BIM5_9ACTN
MHADAERDPIKQPVHGGDEAGQFGGRVAGVGPPCPIHHSSPIQHRVETES